MSFCVQFHPIFREHRPPNGHPERPERLEALQKGLGSAAGFEISEPNRMATRDELSLVHTESLIEAVAATAGKSMSQLDPDTFASSRSYEAACLAVGALLDAVETVTGRPERRIFSLVRPPGHHAEKDRAMGFCLFNNVAVAAEYAIRKMGLKRIAIYDFDVHHGNGTQHIFFDRPDVLYVSHHQYPFYPGTGNWDETGTGDGAGKTVNCPLPAGAGDAEILFLWDRIVGPVIEQFQPELWFLSAGFDGHTLDPLAQLQLTTEGFGLLFARIECLARKLSLPLIYSLEGGYNLQALQEIASLLVTSDQGVKCESLATSGKTPLCDALIEQASKHFSPFWEI